MIDFTKSGELPSNGQIVGFSPSNLSEGRQAVWINLPTDDSGDEVGFLIVANPSPSNPISASDDYYTMTHDQTLTTYTNQSQYGVLHNDSDSNGTLTVNAVNWTTGAIGNVFNLDSGATVTMNSNGTFTYTAAPGFTGIDTFTYTTTDGTATKSATVHISVTNSAPIAMMDNYSILHDHTLTTYTNQSQYGLLHNDSDGDGDTLTITAINGNAVSFGIAVNLSSGATLTVNANGTFTYNPHANWAGQDSFTYTISDGVTTSTVTAYIGVTDSAPNAYSDSYSTTMNHALNISAQYGLLANDSDPNGDAFWISKVQGSAANVGTAITLSSGASLTVYSDGSFTYTPATGFMGMDYFTYEISDGIFTSSTTVYFMVSPF